MNTELMGILGAVMLAVALGALWTNKMKSHVVDGDNFGEDEPDEAAADKKALDSRAKIVMPVAPPQHHNTTDKIEAVAQVCESPLEPDEHQPSPCSVEVNCPDAENNLTVAKTLANMGDYEGASELAELVIESARSSQSQRARAASLVSRSRAR